jgi:hypothetical protein
MHTSRTLLLLALLLSLAPLALAQKVKNGTASGTGFTGLRGAREVPSLGTPLALRPKPVRDGIGKKRDR